MIAAAGRCLGGLVRLVGFDAKAPDAANTANRCRAALALALALLFVANEWRPAYWGWEGALLSLNQLAVATNLSAERGFLGYLHETLDGAGEPVVVPYNRFPLGGALLFRAAMLPFAEPAAQIFAARRLALGFFAAAMLFAYLALQRMTEARVALAAVLLAFSSFYPLQFRDTTSAETAMDLFAVMLAFHGMVLFALDGRLRQLLAKTCVALLLGWHVYALLLPFIGLTAARALLRGGGTVRARLVRLARSGVLPLGAVALAFGLALLTFNFAREYAAVAAGEATADLRQQHHRLFDYGEGRSESAPASGDAAPASLAALPSVEAMRHRLGLESPVRAAPLPEGWRTVAETMLLRTGRAFVPFAAEQLARSLLRLSPDASTFGVGAGKAEAGNDRERTARDGPSRQAGAAVADSAAGTLLRLGGLVALAAGVVAIAYARYRILMATLALVACCWAALVPTGTAAHGFYGMFLVGLPMVVVAVALMRARRLASGRFARGRVVAALHGAVVAAFLAFAASVLLMAARLPTEADTLTALAADYEAMRGLVPEEAILVARARLRQSARVFLPGRTYVTGEQERRCACADLVLAGMPAGADGLLTPNNKWLFLYDAATLRRRYLALGEPLFEDHGWAAHLAGDELLLTDGAPCAAVGANRGAPFFVDAVYDGGGAVPNEYLRGTRTSRSRFRFHERAFEAGGRCLAAVGLAHYPTARLRVGQLGEQEAALWAHEFALPPGSR